MMMICLLKLRTSAGGQYCTKSWGYGGMVDAEDLKSFDHCDRVGSSPTIPTTFRVCDATGGKPPEPTWRRWTKNLISAYADFLLKVLDVWLSWLEHYVHIVGVGGSSPPTSTKNKNGFL